MSAKIYVDTDFILALGKPDDWLKERAERLRGEHEGDLVASLVLFLELFLLAERYGLDRTRLVTDTLDIVTLEGDEDVVFQADELMDQGFGVFDAFHAAHALLHGHRILSSDKRYDRTPLKRIALEE